MQVKKMSNGKLLFGLEIEMEYNRMLIGRISSAGYHDIERNSFGKHFFAESDGSLSTMWAAWLSCR